ncbi:mechanosensitive ion channel [bacterium]|nr:mechanosensitive ion channel [bacterium]
MDESSPHWLDRLYWSRTWFVEKGIDEDWAGLAVLLTDLAVLIGIAWIADFIGRQVITYWVARAVKRSKNEWDDIFFERRVFNGLAHLLPALLIYYAASHIFSDFPAAISLVRKAALTYFAVAIFVVVHRVLKALEEVALRFRYFEGKPVGSFIQLGALLNVLLASVLVLTILIGKNPLPLLGGFAALAAVFSLIFKDTLLGLVASIQMAINDMVRIGDWISMDKYGADGDVEEIKLTTVKVRNFDKTITTVPTYAFVSDSFKNWRGMQSQGRRRIKRSLLIDQSTVQLLSREDTRKMQKFSLVQDYILQRQAEIDAYNRENDIDRSEVINGRNMTNLGVFRQYALEYIRHHPRVDVDEISMVRQLQPTAEGLPLEIYCFVDDTRWVEYETIMADLFDHLIAAVPHFGLQLFQNPSGNDFRKMVSDS